MLAFIEGWKKFIHAADLRAASLYIRIGNASLKSTVSVNSCPEHFIILNEYVNKTAVIN